MKINRKAQLEYISLAVLSFIVLTSGILIANNSSNSTIISTFSITEKTAEIEIWANTSISLELINNNINALLILDNQTVLPEQEIEFYLNESLISTTLTNSQGYAYSNLTSPGNYSLKAEFQGNPFLFFNPSSAEKQIEIIEQNGSIEIMFINKTETNITIETNVTNQTLLTVYTDKKIYMQNETVNIFGEIIINGTKIDTEINLDIEFNKTLVHFALFNAENSSFSYSLLADFENEGEYLVKVFSENLSAETSFYLTLNESFLDLGNMTCKEFEENVLWSSGFSHDNKGSTKYQTWIPKTNCEEAGGQNCFLQDIGVSSRTIYITPDDKEINGKSYIQISSLDKEGCDAPEKGVYNTYLAYESIKGNEGVKKGWYCGYEKEESEDLIKFKPKCNLRLTKELLSESGCFGIKSSAPQSSIMDVFKIKYKLCWDKSYGDSSNEKIRGKNG